MRALIFPVFAVMAVSLFAISADAQRRDFMTDEEIEIVRDAQDIDSRIDVLTKMIDRRFAVLGIEVGGWKGSSKDSDKWGPAPKGEKGDLLFDIKRLLQKAIDDIDNLAEFPNSAPVRDLKNYDDKKAAKDDPKRFPKAVRSLAKAAERYRTPLNSLLQYTEDARDRGSIIDSIDSCDQIIAAITKLPADAVPAKKDVKDH